MRERIRYERIRYLCRASLLVVDEIGYLQVVPGGGNLFFQLVNARYEKATIFTSNCGFAEWGEVFCDPVVADLSTLPTGMDRHPVPVFRHMTDHESFHNRTRFVSIS